MEEFLQYQKKIAAIILGIVIIGAAVLYWLFPAAWQYSAGLFWGGAGGLIVYRMRVLNVIRFAQNPEKAPAKSGFQSLAVMVIFLLLAVMANKYLGQPRFQHDIANLWTAFAGIILPNLVLIADALLHPAAMVAPQTPGDTVDNATAGRENSPAAVDDDDDDKSSDF